MHIEEALNVMTPDLYHRFKRAVELGKWPDGTRLSQEQITTCMQCVIAYEMKHMAPEQRTGFIPPKGSDCEAPANDADEAQPLNWQ